MGDPRARSLTPIEPARHFAISAILATFAPMPLMHPLEPKYRMDTMKFNELVKARQSVRSYDPRPVERQKLLQCLEAARLAPSASNSQPWTFVVVDDPDLKEKVARETYSSLVSFNKFAHQAGALVVMVIEKPKLITQVGSIIKNKEFPLIDIGISAEHFCLQAAELGLGTCMLGWFNQAPIRTLLHIPLSKTIGLIITIGYPASNASSREKVRKSLQDVVRFNGYDQKSSPQLPQAAIPSGQ